MRLPLQSHRYQHAAAGSSGRPRPKVGSHPPMATPYQVHAHTQAALHQLCSHQQRTSQISRSSASLPWSLQGDAMAVGSSSPISVSSSASGDSSSSVGPGLIINGHVDEDISTAEARSSGDVSTSSADDMAPQPQLTRAQKAAKLTQRVVFGFLLGGAGAGVIAYGQLAFLAMILFVVYHATREYWSFMNSKGMSKGMTPSPPIVTAAATVLCLAIAGVNYLHRSRTGTVLAVAAFFLLAIEVVASKRPKFSQLASSVFGLFYCGWLPSFWVKLRMLAISAPVPSDLVVPYAGLLSNLTPWTVGLLATFTTVICIIASDVGAYFVGKNLGRTKLTEISPKKTVEGALGGLVSSITVALLSQQALCWPPTPAAAAGLAVLTFTSSLFGDLIESIMKRDAGMKDSGDLIPGHGGLLDRFDSYMFSGAVTYFYIVFVLPAVGF